MLASGGLTPPARQHPKCLPHKVRGRAGNIFYNAGCPPGRVRRGTAFSSRLGGRVMKLAVRVLSVCCLTVLLNAAPAQNKKPKKDTAKGDPISAAFAMPKKITLDEKQQAKLEELKKAYTPKL